MLAYEEGFGEGKEGKHLGEGSSTTPHHPLTLASMLI